MTEIPPINQTISAVQPVLHRDTINPTDPATQDAFVLSAEAFFDKISETTVEELNTLGEELDASIAAINTVAEEIDTARDETIAARDETVGAIAVLENGTISDTVIEANKAYSNLKVNDLLDKREDKKGTSIASATTTTIGTAGLGDYIHITGTTTITSFGTAANAGVRRTLVFDGALTITNGANLICPGLTDIVTVANTIVSVVAETTTQWRIEYAIHPSVHFAELGFLDGVTSSIQTQLDSKFTTTSATETAQGLIELATTAETQAGTDDTRAITPLKLKNSVLGLGQTLQTFTVGTQRIAGTTYTNSSGKPIWIIIGMSGGSGAALSITAGGALRVFSVPDNGGATRVIVPILNGETYSATTSVGAINYWAEIR